MPINQEKTARAFIPKAFSKMKYEAGGTVVATNPITGEVIGVAHVQVSSQKQLNANLKKGSNSAGSRFIGNTGGLGGHDPHNVHSHLTLFRSAESRRAAKAYKSRDGGSREYDSNVAIHLGDFRRLVGR
jgi:hypothetical protein